MDHFIQIFVQYDRLLNVLSSILGIAGFIFGVWRYLRERQAKTRLTQREEELATALSRLKHLKDFTEGLKQYSRAV